MSIIVQETKARLEGACAEITGNDAHTKMTIEENDAETKRVIEENDVKVKRLDDHDNFSSKTRAQISCTVADLIR